MRSDTTSTTGQRAGHDAERRRWFRGDQIELRHVIGGETWCVLPVTVLADDGHGMAIRISAGSTWLAAVGEDGRRLGTWSTSWTLAERTWTGDDCTYLLLPGTSCAVGYFAGHSSAKFYLNAQSPFRRTVAGVETLDLEIDLEVSEDLRDARWKDLESFRRTGQARERSREDTRRIMSAMLDCLEMVRDRKLRQHLVELSTIRVPVPTLSARPGVAA